jgi:hypothetical protein
MPNHVLYSLTYVPLLHSTYSSHSVYCISTVSDYTKRFLLLRSFTVFKFRLETEMGCDWLYILAILVFSFLRRCSFWRTDAFSWGRTHVILGESGKKIIVAATELTCSQDEGKFGPRSIPLKSWNDYVGHLLISLYI